MPNIKLKFVTDGNACNGFSPKIRIPFFIHGVVIAFPKLFYMKFV